MIPVDAHRAGSVSRGQRVQHGCLQAADAGVGEGGADHRYMPGHGLTTIAAPEQLATAKVHELNPHSSTAWFCNFLQRFLRNLDAYLENSVEVP